MLPAAYRSWSKTLFLDEPDTAVSDVQVSFASDVDDIPGGVRRLTSMSVCGEFQDTFCWKLDGKKVRFALDSHSVLVVRSFTVRVAWVLRSGMCLSMRDGFGAQAYLDMSWTRLWGECPVKETTYQLEPLDGNRPWFCDGYTCRQEAKSRVPGTLFGVAYRWRPSDKFGSVLPPCKGEHAANIDVEASKQAAVETKQKTGYTAPVTMSIAAFGSSFLFAALVCAWARNAPVGKGTKRKNHQSKTEHVGYATYCGLRNEIKDLLAKECQEASVSSAASLQVPPARKSRHGRHTGPNRNPEARLSSMEMGHSSVFTDPSLSISAAVPQEGRSSCHDLMSPEARLSMLTTGQSTILTDRSYSTPDEMPHGASCAGHDRACQWEIQDEFDGNGVGVMDIHTSLPVLSQGKSPIKTAAGLQTSPPLVELMNNAVMAVTGDVSVPNEALFAKSLMGATTKESSHGASIAAQHSSPPLAEIIGDAVTAVTSGMAAENESTYAATNSGADISASAALTTTESQPNLSTLLTPLAEIMGDAVTAVTAKTALFASLLEPASPLPTSTNWETTNSLTPGAVFLDVLNPEDQGQGQVTPTLCNGSDPTEAARDTLLYL
jgi:hypothetical protein